MENEQKLPKRHVGGQCWCGIIHSVLGAMSLNSDQPQGGNYTDVIRREEDGPDPLVQEPNE